MIETPRLILRPWRDSDVPIFIDIGRDPEVMRYFPTLLTAEATSEGVGRIRSHFEREGWGLFAVEVKGGPEFIGFCGIQRVPFEAPFTPAVEIGWRIARAAWGHGYATEAARACLDYARDTLHLPEVVAMVVPDNARSIAVMQRLGMTYVEGGDFDHPRIAEGQIGVGGFPSRRHRLYRITLALVLAWLVACQKGDKPAAPPTDPPTFVERQRRTNEICPKVTAPFFFRVERAGHTSYVLGTRHIGISLAKFPQVVRDRIHDAKLAVFEIDPADNTRTKPPPIDVEAALGPDDWKHFTEIVGPSIAHVSAHGRPAMAVLLASTMFDDYTVQLEKDIQNELEPLHVPMRGLETSRFQDDLIEKLLDLRMLRVLVEQTKNRDEIEQDTRKSLDRYCKGTEKASELSEEDRAKMRAGGYTDAELDVYEDDLVYKRTASWVAPLEQLFADGGVFVAVGAGHLRGERGLPELLRARGWTVTRVTE